MGKITFCKYPFCMPQCNMRTMTRNKRVPKALSQVRDCERSTGRHEVRQRAFSAPHGLDNRTRPGLKILSEWQWVSDIGRRQIWPPISTSDDTKCYFEFKSLNLGCCARSRYQGHGKVITSHRYWECNYLSLPLIPASGTTLLNCSNLYWAIIYQHICNFNTLIIC